MRIVEVATSNLGTADKTLSSRGFSADAIFQIDDFHPKVLLGIEGGHLWLEGNQPGCLDKEPPPKGLSSSLSWMSWYPVGKEKSFSAERRFGYYKASNRSPHGLG